MANVDVFIKNRTIFVKINDLLHLRIATEGLLGIQSWHYDSNFFLEFYFTSGQTIKVEHDNRDIWLNILAGLEKVEW